MALLEILVAPDPRLKEVAQPVTEVTDGIRKLLDDMLETMYITKGVGLAATQAGINKRVIVVDIANPAEGEEPNPMKMVNPVITNFGTEISVYQEGCLSVPDAFEDVERPATCTLEYMDENGKSHVLEADDFLATCIQHEIDHLDGILFVDHISRTKRAMIVKKLIKLQKRGVVFHPDLHKAL
jgi:peptide deformylase